jgi:Protein of unknown function (DUF3147)
VQDVVITILKALAGGSLVVAFALMGEVLHPKWLAGLFSAAPSVALAGLIVTVGFEGDHVAAREGVGMIFGAVAFVAFALLVRRLLDRFGATVASLIGCGAWALVGLGGYFVVFR